jgi:hypothetical protein
MMLASPSAAALVRVVLTLGLGTGCTKMLPPARSSGAMLSDDGISLAVVGQNCAELHAAGVSPARTIEMTLAVEVGNPTPEPVGVHPDRIMLLAPGPISPRFLKLEDSEPVAVAGGTTAPFTVRFVAPGVTCSQELQLDSSSALEWHGRKVVLSAIRFVPVSGPASSP